ncbi:MAG TPA: type 3 dihydrofolate reductase [Thiotrichaceae bacterium]|nr:type 3 dihydrofolate reductase [Thiotrichaceae bacterium]
MQLSIIVAMDRNRVIGRGDTLPWHISTDLKNFKKITMGNPIIMGRKTHESIGRPLPGRENIILTRDKNYTSEGCTVLHSMDEIFEHCKEVDEVMITGGSEIYKLSLEQATRLYLTEVHTEIEGDTFFPEFDRSEWREVSREDHSSDEKNEFDYSFVLLERE